MRAKLTPEQWERVLPFDKYSARVRIFVNKNIELMTLCKEMGFVTKDAYLVRAARCGRGIHSDSSRPYGFLHGKRERPDVSQVQKGRIQVEEVWLWPEKRTICRYDPALRELCRKYGFRPSRTWIYPDGFMAGDRSSVK